MDQDDRDAVLGPGLDQLHLQPVGRRRDESASRETIRGDGTCGADAPRDRRTRPTSSPRCGQPRAAPAVAVPAADARGLPRLPRAGSTRARHGFLARRREDGALVGWLNVSEIVRGALPGRLPRLRRRRRLRGPGLHDRSARARPARGVRHARPAPPGGQHPARATRGRSRSPGAPVSCSRASLQRYLKIGGAGAIMSAGHCVRRRGVRGGVNVPPAMTASNGAGEGHGASVRRVEDPPFLRGTRPYTDDLREPGALYAVFVRSGFAHATINGIDSVGGGRRARRRRRLHRRRSRTSSRSPPPGPPVDTPEEMRRPVLATDKVRFIGEPVAVAGRRDARAGRRRRRARRRRLRRRSTCSST